MKLFRSLIPAALLASSAWAYVVDKSDNGVYVVTWDAGTIAMQIKLPVSTSPVLADGTNYATSVRAAMQTWNAQLGVVQFSSQIIDTPKNPPAGTYSTVISNTVNEIVMDSTYDGLSFGEGTLAVTTTYTGGIDRLQSDMVFNSDPITRDSNNNIVHLRWDSYRGTANGHGTAIDIRRVAIHELGHTLGLDHPDQASPQQSVDAIMNSRISNLDTLQADDIAGAQLLYGAPGFVPPNDGFANATPVMLSNGSIQLTGTNLEATRQSGEPSHAGADAPNGHSVWWRWIAPGSGSTTITTLGSNFDTVLAVYTGSAVSALAPIGSNDDVEAAVPGVNNPDRIITSTVTFNAVGGTAYSIAVDGWGSAAEDLHTGMGMITLNVRYTGPMGTAPTFTIQPASQTISAGNSVTFTVAASGTPAPTFQWKKDGVNISGATGSSYTIANVTGASAGAYTVVATNSAGSATSNAASLTVMIPPGDAVISITVE